MDSYYSKRECRRTKKLVIPYQDQFVALPILVLFFDGLEDRVSMVESKTLSCVRIIAIGAWR